MSARLRSIVSAVLLVVAVVLVPLSVTAVWVRTTFTDTDTYVATVAPLATDPAVTAAVEDRVTEAVTAAVAQQQLLPKATQALEDQGVPRALAQTLSLLSGPLGDRLEAIVRKAVERVVESPTFANVWTTANRVAHTQAVAVLSGDQSGVLASDGTTLSVQLGPVVAAVQDELVAAGVPLADRIPTVDATIPLTKGDDLARAHTAYTVLRAAGVVLPVVALLLLVLGLLLARDRRRAVVRSLAGVASLGVVLLLVSRAVSTHVVDGLKPEVRAAARAVLDTVAGTLRGDLRWLVVVALLLLVVALFAGPGAGAVATRRRVAEGWASAGSVVRSRPWTRAVGAAVAVLAGLVVLVADDLGGGWTFVLCLLALLGGLVVVLASTGDDEQAADPPRLSPPAAGA